MKKKSYKLSLYKWKNLTFSYSLKALPILAFDLKKPILVLGSQTKLFLDHMCKKANDGYS